MKDLVNSDSCIERIAGSLAAGIVAGCLAGGVATGLQTTALNTTKSNVQFPKLTSQVGRGVFLFSSVAAVYTGGKCLAEGLVGKKHPVTSGIGGSCAGMMLGAYAGSFPVFLGATSGFFVIGVVSDVAKDQFGVMQK